MATYRTVHLSFWTDPKVDDDFTPEDKYFYLYLLTNPHTNLCGCYEISTKQMVRETGYSVDTIERLIDRMERIHGVIKYDPDTKEIYILRWGKYNWADSEKTLIGVRKQAESIKSDAFRTEILDRVCMGYPYPIHTSVTDTDTVTDTVTHIEERKKQRKSTRFVPPTLEDIRAYCKQRNSTVDPKTFYEYYTAGEWKDSKGNPVKNWKQKLITWERGGMNGKVIGNTSVHFALENKHTDDGEVFDDIFEV